MEIQNSSDSEEIIMPAGKYKGKSIEDVPNAYLNWLAANLDETKSQKLLLEINKELAFRQKFNITLE